MVSSENRRRYRLLAILGRGGSGKVYKARLEGSAGFTRVVAIKFISEDTERREDFERRLRDEARILSLLNHRAIVRVIDLLRVDNRPAVVLEYVPGCDLESLIERGAIPPRTTCEIIHEVASALNAAHRARDPASGNLLHLIHRDIKPLNVRITASGEVRVLDFGVARAQFGAREAKTQRLAFGTMGYMAPEVMWGEVSSASDVYSLGVVATECLLGRRLAHRMMGPKQHARCVKDLQDELYVTTGEEIGACFSGFLRQMLAYEHDHRPTAAQVARWFKETSHTVTGAWLMDWSEHAVAEARMEEQSLSNSDRIGLAIEDVSEFHGTPDMPRDPAPKRPSPAPPQDPLTPERARSLDTRSWIDAARKGQNPPRPPPLPPRGQVPAPPEPPPPVSQAPAPHPPTPVTPSPACVSQLQAHEASASTPDAPVRSRGTPRRVSRTLLLTFLGALTLLLFVRSREASTNRGSSPSPQPSDPALGASSTGAGDSPPPPGDPASSASGQDAEETPGEPSSAPSHASAQEITTRSQPEDGTEAEEAPGNGTREPSETQRRSRRETRSTGHITVDGDLSGVRFLDAAGRPHPPGDIPVGRYDLEGPLPAGSTGDDAGETFLHRDFVTVRAGWHYLVKCRASSSRCVLLQENSP